MNETVVQCGTCTECCKANPGIVLHPELGDDPAQYQCVQLMRDGIGEPVTLVATNENHDCVYLGPRGCTIYERRPALCRAFDCRKQYLILPRQDRANLISAGLSSKSVFDAARARVHTLSAKERRECLSIRKQFFSDQDPPA